MCGIYLTNIPFTKTEIRSKLKSIDFRGPDNIGINTYNNVSLGHLRLSILDLEERSNQPFNYKNLHITFNGEIYNYTDIKTELIALGYEFSTESDTEVLLIGYYHWGDAIMSKLNGMFAFCIYDSIKNSIFCARDRIGVKPFYYYWHQGEIEICSQLRPLINKKSNVNEEGISAYLACGYIPTPLSAIEHVYKLPQGNILKVDLNKKELNTVSYWDLSPVNLTSKSYEESKEEIHTLLKDAVKIRLQSDVPLGSFLSGGIDSALISSIASNIAKEKINTFSIGFENPAFDESKIAEQYAAILGTNHKTIHCTIEDVLKLIPIHRKIYDEPFSDSSALPSLLLNSVTKEHVTVALSGDGGDESFLGYNYFEFLTNQRYLFRIPSWIKRFLVKTNIIALIRKISGKNIPNDLFLLKDENEFIIHHFTASHSLQKRKNNSWLHAYQSFKNWATDYLQRAADLNIKLWLENDSNVKVDRASMAYSVEVRSPFLDYRIIEKARTLPVSYRYTKNGVRKKILRDILSEYIPEDVFNQPKKGFAIPLGDWIKKELKEEFTTKLDDDFLAQVPNLDIKKFKKQFAEHLQGNADFTTNIWKMYVLRSWYEEFNFYPKK